MPDPTTPPLSAPDLSAPDLSEMFAANRANWDERTDAHLAPGGYGLEDFRAGRGRLSAIEERDLAAIAPDLRGLRVLHLQCHFGLDSLSLAQRGAVVTGLDFSPKAIAAARGLAGEAGLEARFVEANLYDAPDALRDEAPFDLVFVNWGAIYWLPDIEGWARIALSFLRPGGLLYMAEGHPTAFVFDDAAPTDQEGRPGLFVPYFQREAHVDDDPSDYANPNARLENARNYSWMHSLGATTQAILDQGARLRFLREHDAIPWAMFRCLRRGEDGLYRWPGQAWLPLGFSLAAQK